MSTHNIAVLNGITDLHGVFIDIQYDNKYFELKNSWGADGAPQTRTTC